MPKLIKADSVIADRMKEAAVTRMEATPEAWGCTVMLTARGNLYAEVMPQPDDWQECEERLLAQLSQEGDTEVEYFLSWPGIVPSWRIRVGLPELNPRNQETRVLAPQEGEPRYSLLVEFQPVKKKVRIGGVEYVHESDMGEDYVETGRFAGHITSVVSFGMEITRDDEANFGAALNAPYIRYADNEHPDAILVPFDSRWLLFCPSGKNG